MRDESTWDAGEELADATRWALTPLGEGLLDAGAAPQSEICDLNGRNSGVLAAKY